MSSDAPAAPVAIPVSRLLRAAVFQCRPRSLRLWDSKTIMVNAPERAAAMRRGTVTETRSLPKNCATVAATLPRNRKTAAKAKAASKRYGTGPVHSARPDTEGRNLCRKHLRAGEIRSRARLSLWRRARREKRRTHHRRRRRLSRRCFPRAALGSRVDRSGAW